MSGIVGEGVSSEQARTAWVENRFFKYRGCAPDADDPSRMAGNPSLPVGAHHALDAWVSESPAERKAREAAAIEVCLNCPVMVLCDQYASSIRPDGKLAEPDGVWGGRRALERHKALIKARHAAPAAPERRFHTAQKQAVLKAFASCWDPYEVAEAAGVDVRTANWQRSSLTTLLGLPRTASRAQLLAAAEERGLLDGVAVVADDGSVPAVPPPTRMPDRPEPDPVPGLATVEPSHAVLPEPGPYEPTRVPSPRRGRFTDIEGQLALWEAELSDLAEVHYLFPDTVESLKEAV